MDKGHVYLPYLGGCGSTTTFNIPPTRFVFLTFLPSPTRPNHSQTTTTLANLRVATPLGDLIVLLKQIVFFNDIHIAVKVLTITTLPIHSYIYILYLH